MMHSRHARNLCDPKIKRIFEIVWMLFEIILFIYFYPLKLALGRSQKHFMKKNYIGLLFTTSNKYIWTKKNLDFPACVKKCNISLSEKLTKWHFLTHAWKSNFFWAKFLLLKCFERATKWLYPKHVSSSVQVLKTVTG